MNTAILTGPRPALTDRAELLKRSLRRHTIVGLAVMAALVVGLGGWAVVTEIAGAVVANGVVAVEGGSKKVQHPDGGVVKQILVRDDQVVEAGEVLVRLDDVATRADLDVIMAQLRDAIGEDARLAAESTDAPNLILPAIVENWPVDPDLAAVMGDQSRLLQVQRASLASQLSQIDEQVAQKQAELDGLEAQLSANDQQLSLFGSENANLDKLKAGGLVGQQRVNELKRGQAQLEGQQGSVKAAIAAAKSEIAQLQMQRTQLDTDFHSKALADLQTQNQVLAELVQKKIAAQQKLSRLEIRAPITGTIHDSAVHTVGGVVTPGQTLMMIVPTDAPLLIDTRISPLDVDKVHVGQPAMVQMSGLDPRVVPQLEGHVTAISPDLTTDELTRAQYYTAKVEIGADELAKLPEQARLVPGMPSEVFVETGDRTVWSYLVHPLVELFNHAFREQ
jgi:HlyD family secretion protein